MHDAATYHIIYRNAFQYYTGIHAACRGILNVSKCCAGYIGEFEFVDDHRGGKIVVELNGRWVTLSEGFKF